MVFNEYGRVVGMVFGGIEVGCIHMSLIFQTCFPYKGKHERQRCSNHMVVISIRADGHYNDHVTNISFNFIQRNIGVNFLQSISYMALYLNHRCNTT